MKWDDRSIGDKVRIGFLSVTAIFILALLLIAFSTREVDEHAGEAIEEFDLSVTLLMREIDHLKWAQALSLFVHKHGATDLPVSADGTKCAFGRWYYGEDRKKIEQANPELRPFLSSIEQPHLQLHETAAAIQKLKREGGQEAAEGVYNTQTLKHLGAVQELLQKMREKVKAAIDFNRSDMFNHLGQLKAILYVSSALAVLAAVALSLVLARSIAGPVRELAASVDVIASGDLSRSCSMARQDELGQLSRAVALMVAGLNAKIAEVQAADESAARVHEALAKAEEQERKVAGMLDMIRSIASEAAGLSDNLSGYAGRLAEQVEHVNQGAKAQKERLAEASEAMGLMNSTVLEVARNAGEAAASATTAQEKASEGAHIVIESVKAIDRVSALAEQLRGNMDELGGKAQSIGQVMNVISDIADQTNLLALNAAIEAARAGEAGRGFAVVADEVRKLAEKTVGATQEVGVTIRAIQDSVRISVTDMEEASKAVARSNELAGQSGEALKEIVSLTGVNTKNVQSITAAAEEQSSASDHIIGSLGDVNGVAQETERGMAETVEIVRNLAAMAKQLKRIIDQMDSRGEGGESSRSLSGRAERPGGGRQALPPR